ncbi:Predicted permease, DMT superfamily protein [Vibrio chagasii]|uniref:DMT family transporter n=1 Tax=Vibrio chagasii TaxID=170679 RepID=UPI0016413633|nr:DMT family transporter [Vibrio chagasii]MCG9560291.1 DMT family transporter [Vibrio chagasii]CAH6856650.1 Predicted permease, DMT superfamily protein [Vibrio chagasii]CAH7149599.1 Predicted permease, DMT superfamily protein [Vibrio chagasii]CAH7188633.1 Predicted permease, DMT superfamily protein [Vibrio chagasii]CAH7199758.1 Predicted permease, DMT superfamily protein [Vibrio chagasii]
MYIGEIAAIGAAIVWACATWIYGQFGHRFSAMQLNIIKGLVASVMMLLVMPLIPMPEFELSANHFWILAISGIIGIAIGDSAYFAALKRIGANKTLLLESLAPPLSGVLALMFLGAALTLQSWLGVVITTLAVTFVVFQPSNSVSDDSTNQAQWSGIGYGLVASVCQASGVVISHYALVAGDIPPLLGALIRLAIGVFAVMIIIPFVENKPYSSIKRDLWEMTKLDKLWLLSAIFVGTFLALWLQQIALKNANPAIAQTLIATSPVFILVIYALKGEKVSKQSLIGTLAAVGGISLFFYQ